MNVFATSACMPARWRRRGPRQMRERTIRR
jgi:hypothetical protein